MAQSMGNCCLVAFSKAFARPNKGKEGERNVPRKRGRQEERKKREKEGKRREGKRRKKEE